MNPQLYSDDVIAAHSLIIKKENSEKMWKTLGPAMRSAQSYIQSFKRVSSLILKDS